MLPCSPHTHMPPVLATRRLCSACVCPVMSPPSCSASLHWSLHTARSSVNLPVHTPAPCRFPSLIPSCATLSLPHSRFPTPSSYTAPLPQPSALLVRVLLCCRPCLGSLTSWCRPAQWAWDAALQPLSEASPTSSHPFPEHDFEGGSGWLPQLWGGRGCSLKGMVGGPSAPGLQTPTLFY